MWLKQLILCGFGGQGIVLAGNILARAAFDEGKYVASVNSYGAAARGGACRADVIISEKPICFPRVMEADVMIAMSQSACQSNLQTMKNGGLIIYDPDNVTPETFDPDKKYLSVPATRTADRELHSGAVANLIMLGATARAGHIVSLESLSSAIKETVRPEHVKLNLRALDLGFKLGSVDTEKETRKVGVHVAG
jgi:2-oxoglutarate ferredoxin oxidoreductase subunit gamma